MKAVIFCAALLTGCAAAPEPFDKGEETAPPIGCMEYKTRGGNC